MEKVNSKILIAWLFIVIGFAFHCNSASAEGIGTNAEEVNNASSPYDSIEISLITCEPHEEVYSLYGHTAIRINDKVHGQDIAINYGVFDSSDPNFIPHFIFGLTDYTMEMFPMSLFLREYEYYGSAVREQVLNLTDFEKQDLINALFENYKPENKNYRYNFFYNNCTTKARDIILSNIRGDVKYRTTFMQQGERSFRELIHWKNEGYPWAAEGNDLLLGVKADMNTTQEERQFLPEILMNDFDSATIVCSDGSKRPLVKSSSWILHKGQSRMEPMASFPLRPMWCAVLFVLIILGVTLYEKFKYKKILPWIDWTLFTIFGLMGLVLTAMLFSEHPTVRENFQIFLFNPLWLLYCPLRNKFKWVDKVADASIIIFLFAAFFQNYAEGTIILAWCLLLRLYIHYDKTK